MSDDESTRYWSLIDSAIVQRAPGAPSLEQLVVALPGVYPADVVRRLQHLNAAGRIDDACLERLQPGPRVRVRPECCASRLPLPHPLDFEWRFTSPSAQSLLRAAGATGAAKMAFLGTPFLAECAASMTPSCAVHLFERRAEACAALARLDGLTIHCVDLADCDASVGPFDVAIADPPWYPAVIDIFIHAASRLLAAGGALLLAGPALGTRPSIAAERMRATEFADRCGLTLTGVSPAALRYESPPFEMCALKSARLDGMPLDWRAADLFSFVKTGEPRSFAADVNLAERPSWQEVTVGAVRIRVRYGPTIDGPPVAGLVEGDVLDSVSRRDPRRQDANVMTTANCIYRTASPSALLDSLQTVAGGRHTTASGPIDDEYLAAAMAIIDRDLALLRGVGVAC